MRQRREPHGGRDHVVGALRHVDVIVGMHRRVRAPRSPPSSSLARFASTSLVHVVAGAGAGLIHVDDELVAMLAAEHLVGRLHDGVGETGVEAPGLLVRQCGRALDPDYRIDERPAAAEVRRSGSSPAARSVWMP